VRVDVELLDSLMRLVGELVLARNQLVSRLGDEKDSSKDSSLARSAQRLSLVTSELQEQVMKTRMQPVDAVWSKMPRVVRDLARTLGKQVRLEMEGRETELDRSVLEAIKDPLTHLVRNAVDHGIESAEARAAAGKPAEGVLTLRAYHEAGPGPPRDHRGRRRHRPGADRREGDRARPGEPGPDRHHDSPRDHAPDLPAGILDRREDHERLGPRRRHGRRQDPHRGDWRLRRRLQQARPGLCHPADHPVDAGDHPGADDRVRRPSLRGPAGERPRAGPAVGRARPGRHRAHLRRPVYRLRDMLLPLVRLDEQLGLVPMGTGGRRVPRRRRAGWVHRGPAGRSSSVSAWSVDDVLDTQEIVVKPLGRHLKGIPVYAGATILGDGSVVLILDASTLARRANVLSGVSGVATVATDGNVEAVDPVLVVEIGGDRRAAIPLEMVTRLEEISKASVEHVGGREVVQYRGHIMPLVRIATLLGVYADSAGEDSGVQLVVYTRGERSVRVVVQRILDIATERSAPYGQRRPALVGSSVVASKGSSCSHAERRDVGRPALLHRLHSGLSTTPRHRRGSARIRSCPRSTSASTCSGATSRSCRRFVRLQQMTPVPLASAEMAA
jgi:two-component system chemotaxis sensor kinase CheA